MAHQTTGTSTTKPCALTFGTSVVQFTGAVDNELVGSVVRPTKKSRSAPADQSSDSIWEGIRDE
jgi:hypothetical protein